MIVFDLRCAQGHTFEEWFDSSADYEAQKADGSLACPECGETHVDKALMAPAVATSGAAAPQAPCGAPACATGMCPALGNG